jgi:hypothetical protein
VVQQDILATGTHQCVVKSAGADATGLKAQWGKIRPLSLPGFFAVTHALRTSALNWSERMLFNAEKR